MYYFISHIRQILHVLTYNVEKYKQKFIYLFSYRSMCTLGWFELVMFSDYIYLHHKPNRDKPIYQWKYN